MVGKTTTSAPTSPWQRVINTNRFEGLQKFIREAMAEIKKVIWPDRETTRNLTLVVIAVSIVLGVLLGGIDYVLFQLFEALP
jgi:preprotein translocase subunit SecE